MKQSLYRTWALTLMALSLIGIPTAHAANYELGTPIQEWSVGNPGGFGTDDVRSMTISGDEMYVLYGCTWGNGLTDGQIWYTKGDQAKSWGSFATGGLTPHGIASDQVGNIVIQSGGRVGSNWSTLKTYSASATDASSMKSISVSSHGIVRGDYMGASGRLRSAAGGYVWTGSNATSTIRRIKIYSQVGAETMDEFTGLPVANSTTSQVVPNRDDDSNVLFSAGGQTNDYYHLRLNESNKTLTQVRKITAGPGRPAMVGTGDKSYYIYSVCEGLKWKVTKTAFKVENVNNPDDNVTVTIHTNEYTATNLSGVLLDAQLKGDFLYVYAFQPSVGGWCYRIPVQEVYEQPAPEGPSNLSYQGNVWDYETADPHRVDLTLSWTPGDESLVSQKIQRFDSDTNKWIDIKTLSATESTCTLENVALQDYTYRVVGIDADDQVIEGENNEITNTIKVPAVPRWIGEPRTYDGYGKVQLRWERRHGYKPDGYNIYFDEELLESCYPVANYVHNNVASGTHTYRIESVYKNSDGTIREFTFNGETLKGVSQTVSVKVLPIDMGLNQYSIQEVYNYRIDKDEEEGEAFDYPKEDGSFNSWLNNPDLYRQGAFYKGYWFVAQRENSNGTYGSGTSGAILRFDANAGSKGAMSASMIKVCDLFKGQTAGIAIDEGGAIYVNKPTGTTGWGFANPVKGGQIIVLNSTLDGVERRIDLDLSPVGIEKRCDYYSVKGNMLSDEGAYLYMGESGSNAFYCIHIKNGELDDWHKFDHTGQTYTVSSSAEPYIFPVDQRNDVVHGLRSQGYYNVDFNRPAGTEGQILYTAESRTSNAGGITHWYNNRMFIITPECPFSRNTGDFYLGLAASNDGYGVWAADPSTCVVDNEHIMPLLTFSQSDDSDVNKATNINSNGNWYGIEDVGGDTDTEHNGFYIYQYVPGMRFAKYHVSSTYDLPDSKVRLDVKLRYTHDENDNPYDIEGMDGHVTWSTIQGFGGEYESITYRKIHAYEVILLNDKGEELETVYYDAAGVLSDKASLADIEYVAPTDALELTHVFRDIDESNFTARVTVYFRDINTMHIVSADPRHQDNSGSYFAAPVSNPSVKVLYMDIVEDDVEKKVYRMDIDFNIPDFEANDTQPRSHYHVAYRKPGESEWNIFDNLALTQGSQMSYRHRAAAAEDAETDAEPAYDTTEVPGSYDFKTRAVCPDGGNEDPAVVYRYHLAESANSVEDPRNWEYQIVASYAANTEVVRDGLNSIAKDGLTPAFTATDGGTTHFENVMAANTFLKAYPIPARSTVNIDCGQPLKSVEVYSLTGARMLSVRGNGETRMSINVASIPAGTYLLKVNSDKVVKLIKL